MRRLLLGSILATGSVSVAADPPERAALLRKAYTVRPNATDFVWQQIPWHVSPEAALKEARAENRPLFVWLADGPERDGSPLERCVGYAAELRAGPLNDVAVVRTVAAYFVPVALNAAALSPDTDAGKFFRALTKEWSQGLWLVTPGGKTLAAHYHRADAKRTPDQNRKRWLDDTRGMLADGVKEAGELRPRAARPGNPFPDRGYGPTGDGGVRLAVSVIALRHDRQDGPSAVDSVGLSKAEWAAFAPPENAADWTVPDAAAKRFAPALAPATDALFVPQARDVTEARLTAKVVRAEGGRVVVHYAGAWKARGDGDPKRPTAATAAGEGVGVYDPARKEMVSLLFVLRGKYTSGAAAVPTAAVVEWERDRPKE